MTNHPVLRVLVVMLASTLMSSGISNGAALVGEVQHIEIEAEPIPALEQLMSIYRRPDFIPFPASDAYTAAKAFLGRVLFHDTRISGNDALSCASCHNSGFSYGDGRAKGIGDRMNSLDRRSPSILNSAWGDRFMWDGRAATLEEQVAGPIENPSEMNQSLDPLVIKLAEIGEYRSLFSTAFPDQSITSQTIASAIATYERTLVSSIAPFDRWIDGDNDAVTEPAKRGFALFNAKAQCASCHGGWLFTDDGFHDIGLPDDDVGRGRLFPNILAMQHAFKTPNLRETARRGPYMHDGSLPTLAAVIAHYNQGGVKRPSRSELITPLGLSQEEQMDLVAFLQTLTSDVRLDAAPALPR
jgi:cytochrome c peroxidase